MGHMKRDCLVLQGNQVLNKGVERPTTGATSYAGPLANSRRPINIPRPTITQASVQQPWTQGRVYVLTQQDARASSTLLESTIYLAVHTAQALFDPCATHSFISNKLAHKLKQSPESLKYQLVISPSVGTEIISSMIYKGVRF